MKLNLVFSAAIMLSAAMMACFFSASLQAQSVPITFTGGSGSSMSDSVTFNFPTGGSVAIDQLGTREAIDQNNDSMPDGQTLFAVPAPGGPIDSIGVVESGDPLAANQDFGGVSIDLDSVSDDPFFAGFNAGGDVGYFQISRNIIDNSITYSQGFFGQNGASLTVGSAVVPEPSTFAGIGLLAILTATRRRRRS